MGQMLTVFFSLQISDVGGTIVVHTFGAYFGLAASLLLYRADQETDKCDTSYTSDMSSMIGKLKINFITLYSDNFSIFETFVGGEDKQKRRVYSKRNRLRLVSLWVCRFYSWNFP